MQGGPMTRRWPVNGAMLSLPALICVFVPLVAACFSVNYVLDGRHNVLEDKTITVAPAAPFQPASALADGHHKQEDAAAGTA